MADSVAALRRKRRRDHGSLDAGQGAEEQLAGGQGGAIDDDDAVTFTDSEDSSLLDDMRNGVQLSDSMTFAPSGAAAGGAGSEGGGLTPLGALNALAAWAAESEAQGRNPGTDVQSASLGGAARAYAGVEDDGSSGDTMFALPSGHQARKGPFGRPETFADGLRRYAVAFAAGGGVVLVLSTGFGLLSGTFVLTSVAGGAAFLFLATVGFALYAVARMLEQGGRFVSAVRATAVGRAASHGLRFLRTPTGLLLASPAALVAVVPAAAVAGGSLVAAAPLLVVAVGVSSLGEVWSSVTAPSVLRLTRALAREGALSPLAWRAVVALVLRPLVVVLPRRAVNRVMWVASLTPSMLVDPGICVGAPLLEGEERDPITAGAPSPFAASGVVVVSSGMHNSPAVRSRPEKSILRRHGDRGRSGHGRKARIAPNSTTRVMGEGGYAAAGAAPADDAASVESARSRVRFSTTSNVRHFDKADAVSMTGTGLDNFERIAGVSSAEGTSDGASSIELRVSRRIGTARRGQKRRRAKGSRARGAGPDLSSLGFELLDEGTGAGSRGAAVVEADPYVLSPVSAGAPVAGIKGSGVQRGRGGARQPQRNEPGAADDAGAQSPRARLESDASLSSTDDVGRSTRDTLLQPHPDPGGAEAKGELLLSDFSDLESSGEGDITTRVVPGGAARTGWLAQRRRSDSSQGNAGAAGIAPIPAARGPKKRPPPLSLDGRAGQVGEGGGEGKAGGTRFTGGLGAAQSMGRHAAGSGRQGGLSGSAGAGQHRAVAGPVEGQAEGGQGQSQKSSAPAAGGAAQARQTPTKGMSMLRAMGMVLGLRREGASPRPKGGATPVGGAAGGDRSAPRAQGAVAAAETAAGRPRGRGVPSLGERLAGAQESPHLTLAGRDGGRGRPRSALVGSLRDMSPDMAGLDSQSDLTAEESPKLGGLDRTSVQMDDAESTVIDLRTGPHRVKKGEHDRRRGSQRPRGDGAHAGRDAQHAQARRPRATSQDSDGAGARGDTGAGGGRGRWRRAMHTAASFNVRSSAGRGRQVDLSTLSESSEGSKHLRRSSSMPDELRGPQRPNAPDSSPRLRHVQSDNPHRPRR